jgi:hypothetical protein
VTWKDCLVLGTKLIGVDCLTTAIQELFYNLSWKLGQIEQAGFADAIFTVSVLVTLLIPVIMTALGFYLVRDGRIIHDYAFRIGDELSNRAQNWLALGILLVGLYAITISIPDAVRILSNLIVVMQAPAYLSTEDWWEQIYLNFLPTTSTFVLGLVGLANSKALARTALR